MCAILLFLNKLEQERRSQDSNTHKRVLHFGNETRFYAHQKNRSGFIQTG